ncbi:MAG: hypothetical protein J4G14_11850 [Dehalococcoidia bacterium]|nr:hypothetical protein [Dehalococcoidia bacterium]
MDSNSVFVTAILLSAALMLLAVVACAEEYVPPTPMPPAPPAPAPTAVATEVAAPVRRPPPPPPTPTLEERRLQTPTDFGSNTRVVDGDIQVWHVPHCPPVPPASWVAPIILTHLVPPYSYLYLNRDGSVLESPAPDYRTDESRERFAEVLEDSALMELILTRFECP